jgi:hypothetical protein
MSYDTKSVDTKLANNSIYVESTKKYSPMPTLEARKTSENPYKGKDWMANTYTELL